MMLLESYHSIINYFAQMDQSLIKNILHIYFTRIEYFAIFYLFIANSLYAIIILFGYINSRKKHAQSLLRTTSSKSTSSSMLPVSVLAACYNEEASIHQSTLALLKLNYPLYEVIIINDGSNDSSMDVLIDKFDLVKTDIRKPSILKIKQVKAVYMSKKIDHLIVIDKLNGGKSDALNAGIVYSNYPLVCCVDADSDGQAVEQRWVRADLVDIDMLVISQLPAAATPAP